MRAIRVASLLLLGLVPSIGQAQDKSKPEEKPKSEAQSTPVKATVVFAEYEGDKKMKSLPYTLYINAPDSPELKPGWVKLRVGSRVPVYTGKDQFTYFDVGTNIDARGAYTPEGHILLYLSLERSWVEGDVVVPIVRSDSTEAEASAGRFRQPVVRQFKSELDLKLREGQVLESTMATDPLSGKVMKVEVSVSVVK